MNMNLKECEEYFRGLDKGVKKERARVKLLLQDMLIDKPETLTPFDVGHNLAIEKAMAAMTKQI